MRKIDPLKSQRALAALEHAAATVAQTPESQQPEGTDLSEAQAALVLGVSRSALRQWRYRDARQPDGQHAKSPPWKQRTPHRVAYNSRDLLAWLKALPTRDGVPVLPDRRFAAAADMTTRLAPGGAAQ